jgi:hypothetical protein
MKALSFLLLTCSFFACSKKSDSPVNESPVNLIRGTYIGNKLEIQQTYGDTSTILRPEVWEDYNFSIETEVINQNKIRVSIITNEPIKNKVIELPLKEEVDISGGTRYFFSEEIRKPDQFLSTSIRVEQFNDSSKATTLFVNFTKATIADKIMDQETVLASAEKN